MQRVRSDGADRRLLEKQRSCRRIVRGGILVNLAPTRGEAATDDTRRQSNTHIIESREVRYPWHPWHGRTVWIYQALRKQGEGIFRCRIDQDPSVRLQELPEWMFDTAASQIQIAMRAAVSCEALRNLKALLRGNPAQPGRGGVVENQHQSLQSSGGADGQAAETSWIYSTPTIPNPSPGTCSGRTYPSKFDKTR